MRVIRNISVLGGAGYGICSRLSVSQPEKNRAESAREQSLRLEALDEPFVADGELAQALIRLWRDMLGEIRQRCCEGEFQCAEDGVRRVSAELSHMLRESANPRLRERAADLSDMAERMIGGLSRGALIGGPPFGAVMVAERLTVFDALDAVRARTAAVLTESFNPLSHAAIVLRGGGVPIAWGFQSLSDFPDGTRVLVDSRSKCVVIGPDEETLRTALANNTPSATARGKISLPDGTDFHIAANCGGSWETVDGDREIGLLRTEFFYERLGRLPTEEELTREYANLARRCPALTVRLLDAGADKPIPGFPETTDCGARGVALLLRMPEILDVQLRAILRASVYGRIRVLLPMTDSPQELFAVRSRLRDCREFLASRGVCASENLPVGVMIETPKAVAQAGAFALRADFANVGTNDLTARAAGVLRDGAASFQPNRAVLGWIEYCAGRFREAGKPLCVCGEMAGASRWIDTLIRLGVRSVSVTPSAASELEAHLNGRSFASSI